MSDDQTEVKVDVYQGEHSLCKDNTLLGTYTLRGLRRQVVVAEHQPGILQHEFAFIGGGAADEPRLGAAVGCTD